MDSVRQEASIYIILMSIRDMTYLPVFFCHYRGGIFIQGEGKILLGSHQEGTILPLNSSGETIIYFLLDNSWVGPIRFENPLPTVVPICPDLQN